MSFLNFFGRRAPAAAAVRPRVEAGRRVYAVGDIHGRNDLLVALLDMIRADDRARGAAETVLILLGDLIGWALADGRRELHFLRGDEDYKYAWGAVDRFNAARRLLPPPDGTG